MVEPAFCGFFTNAQEQRLRSMEIGTLGQPRKPVSLVEFSREFLGARNNVLELHVATLDREQLVANVPGHLERCCTVAEPTRGREQQPEQVVGVLGSEPARRVKRGEMGQRMFDECPERFDRQEPLVVHRAVELLDVLLGLESCIRRARCHDARALGQSCGGRVQSEQRIVTQPSEKDVAMLGEAQRPP